jgi:putative Holliday junction resolvase
MKLASTHIIALDLGDRKTGAAGVEQGSGLASPLSDLAGMDQKKILKRQIGALLREKQCETLVLGMPFDPHGQQGSQAQKVAAFARSLQATFPTLAIETVDERFTSFQADQEMREMNLSGKRRKKSIHAASAVLILENYLAEVN